MSFRDGLAFKYFTLLCPIRSVVGAATLEMGLLVLLAAGAVTFALVTRFKISKEDQAKNYEQAMSTPQLEPDRAFEEPQPRVCSYCGHNNLPDAETCKSCGTLL